MTHCWLRYNSESWSPAHDGTTADEEDSTLATAAMIRSHLAEGALRVGRQPGEVTVTSLLPTAVGETRQQALDALRPGLAFYAGFFPRYNRLDRRPRLHRGGGSDSRGLGARRPERCRAGRQRCND